MRKATRLPMLPRFVSDEESEKTVPLSFPMRKIFIAAKPVKRPKAITPRPMKGRVATPEAPRHSAQIDVTMAMGLKPRMAILCRSNGSFCKENHFASSPGRPGRGARTARRTQPRAKPSGISMREKRARAMTVTIPVSAGQ